MTTATELMMTSNNADHAMTRAEAMAVGIDQNWGAESTLYTFDDLSVLVISGPQLNAFESLDAATESSTTKYADDNSDDQLPDRG